MFQHLENLKRHGYIPDTILDIGGLVKMNGHTIAISSIRLPIIFYLFEPVKYPELNKLNDLPLILKRSAINPTIIVNYQIFIFVGSV